MLSLDSSSQKPEQKNNGDTRRRRLGCWLSLSRRDYIVYNIFLNLLNTQTCNAIQEEKEREYILYTQFFLSIFFFLPFFFIQSIGVIFL